MIQLFGTELEVDLRQFAPQSAVPHHSAVFQQKFKLVLCYAHYYLLWVL